jgi:hypothetical protein
MNVSVRLVEVAANMQKKKTRRFNLPAPWDEAISASKEALVKVEAKATRLRTNIQVLEESRNAGEPWPTQLDDQNSDSATQR